VLLLWLKALHLIFVVAWFAGLFYMFRLLVYQVENREKPEVLAVLRHMAERLYHVITTPAMIATLVFGLGMLVLNPAYLVSGWLLAKLVGVAGLVAYHLYVGRVRKRFAVGDYYLTSRQCRLRNEIPTGFLVVIVLLAVLRPVLWG
jgi:putative membrane protein